ncbi:MAG TPA: hypothetical protein VN763_13315, partial [Saprospiraceae bacterium]|nr:hypothetical protein [Saprospiraceae bacterium]
MFRKLIFNILLLCISSNNQLVAQTFYISGDFLNKLELNNNLCSCEYSTIGYINTNSQGSTFAPDGQLYILVGDTIFQADLSTAVKTVFFVGPPGLPNMYGIVCTEEGIFYTMPSNIPPISDILYKWDTNAGTVTTIGSTGFAASNGNSGELAMQGGKVYRIYKE